MIARWKDLSEDYVKKKKKSSGRFPKKIRLGPQNGSRSLGLEKLLKIENCAIIKETKKLKEALVGIQVELGGGHQYPLGSLLGKHLMYGKIIQWENFHRIT